jgi:hypothetical protein
MNDKKAKELRKIVGFKPKDKRDYTTTLKGQIVAEGPRRLYQTAKKKIRWE